MAPCVCVFPRKTNVTVSARNTATLRWLATAAADQSQKLIFKKIERISDFSFDFFKNIQCTWFAYTAAYLTLIIAEMRLNSINSIHFRTKAPEVDPFLSADFLLRQFWNLWNSWKRKTGGSRKQIITARPATIRLREKRQMQIASGAPFFLVAAHSGESSSAPFGRDKPPFCALYSLYPIKFHWIVWCGGRTWNKKFQRNFIQIYSDGSTECTDDADQSVQRVTSFAYHWPCACRRWSAADWDRRAACPVLCWWATGGDLCCTASTAGWSDPRTTVLHLHKWIISRLISLPKSPRWDLMVGKGAFEADEMEEKKFLLPVRMPESNPCNGKRHPFDGCKIMK